MAELSASATVKEINTHIKKLRHAEATRAKFNNPLIGKDLQEQLAHAQALLNQLKAGPSSEKGNVDTWCHVRQELMVRPASSTLPKAILEALKLVATPFEVEMLMAELDMLLSGEDRAPPMDDVDLEGIDIGEDWDTGVEEYAKMPLSDVWAELGRAEEQTVPFFNTREDPAGSDPWTEEGIAALNHKDAKPFGPRWHQLVGVMKLLDNMFNDQPVLLMDDVGVGKTMQVIAFVCFRAFFFAFYQKHQRFPGKYGAYLPWHRISRL